MWRERISEWSADVSFHPPATAAAITDGERALGQKLPDDLVGLLHETNGIGAPYGFGLIWPVERIRNDNLRFRTDPDYARRYLPFDSMMFFADAGNGDQFAFISGDRPDNDVVAWDHQTDSRTRFAGSLAAYLEWWLDGRIHLMR